MLAYHKDWEIGIHPVSTGRAPWLSGPFMHAMHACSSATSEALAQLRKDRERK